MAINTQLMFSESVVFKKCVCLLGLVFCEAVARGSNVRLNSSPLSTEDVTECTSCFGVFATRVYVFGAKLLHALSV